eukprot:scpid63030/ scgid13757/ 
MARPGPRKITQSLFDIIMRSYDGAEARELVGAYLLNQLSEHLPKEQIGLYRDDGLAVMENVSGSAAERLKKKLVAVFTANDLRVTIETNLKVVSFLDVTFNLFTGGYRSHRKPGDAPRYIHTRSNHPPNILQQLPAAISKHVSMNSSDADAFSQAAPMYNAALSASGYTETIQYIEPEQGEGRKKKRKRKRHITWFNPPFSRNVHTNVAATFLKLIDRHFKNTPLAKLFNHNNVKVSYCCMPNVAASISSHNMRLLTKATPEKPCSCRKKNECPLEGRCLASHIIIRGTCHQPG